MPNLLVQNTIANGPKPLSSVPLNCRRAVVVACKSLAGPTVGPNSATVKIGRSPTASEQPFEMASGDERTYEAPARGRLDLSKLFFTVAADNDGLVVDYE